MLRLVEGHAAEHRGDERDREADYVEVAAVDAGNPTGSAALDGIGTGLIKRLAGADVSGDLGLADGMHCNPGELGCALSTRGGVKTDAGDDLVSGAGEQAEHAGGVFSVSGLAKGGLVGSDHDRVGTEDVVVCSGVSRRGFFPGEAEGEGDGVLAGVLLFRNVGGLDGEGVAGLGEDFSAAWGSGGEDEHRRSGFLGWMGLPAGHEVAKGHGCRGSFSPLPVDFAQDELCSWTESACAGGLFIGGFPICNPVRRP